MCEKTDNGFTNIETEYMVIYIANNLFLYNNCIDKSAQELEEFFNVLQAFLSNKYEDEDLELTGSLLHATHMSYCDNNIRQAKEELLVLLFDIGSLWRVNWDEVYHNTKMLNTLINNN